MTIKSLTIRHNKICSYVIMSLITMSFLSSCEKDLPLYDDPTCRLNFYYQSVSSTEDFDASLAGQTYSFVYSGENVVRDTIWVDVETMGFTSDKDRPVELQQLDTTANMAVAGRHYVAFDDPSLADYYKIPAGQARASLPIVLLRDESLKDTSVVLKFGFKETDYFKHGYPVFQARSITFTDRLAEPANWNKAYHPYPNYPSISISFSNYFGAYGVVKHQFLINKTGNAWDDDYIDELMTGDSNYLYYMMQKMQKLLAEENASRAERGLEPLTEADGTVVFIGYSR